MLKRILSIFLSILTAVLIAASAPVSASADDAPSLIPDNAIVYNGHYYSVLSGYSFETWADAESFCEVLGGHLATITSAEENAVVYRFIRSLGYDTAYFGYTDRDKEGTWKWVNGEKSSYTNWADEEPNNTFGNEDFAEFYWQYPDGRWNDGNFCHGTVGDTNTIICEWDDNFGTVLPNDWRDGYSFRNLVENIDKEYYVKLFEQEYNNPQYGAYLFEKLECKDGDPNKGYADPHGNCYGMALSAMSSVCRATPAPSAYNKNYRNVYDIGVNDVCSTGLSVKDYIKYAQIYWNFKDVVQTETDSEAQLKQDLTPLVDAVRDYISNPVDPVMLTIRGEYPVNNVMKQVGHSVWAVGIKEDDDYRTVIMVYDSNDPGELRTLELYKKNGRYASWRYVFDVSLRVVWGTGYPNSSIACSRPLIGFLQRTRFQPATLAPTGAASTEANYDRLMSFNAENVTVTDASGKVIGTSGENLDGRLLPIRPLDTYTSSGSDTVYWADLDGDVQFRTSSQAQDISICSSESYVDLTLPANSSTNLDFSNDNMDTISMDLSESGEFSLNFHVFDDSDDGETSEDVIYIEGEGSDTATIQRTQDGVILEGVDNFSIRVNDDSFDFASKYYTDSDHKTKVLIEDKEIASVSQDTDGNGSFETGVRGKYLWGDANIDGEVSSIDATFLLRVSSLMDVEYGFRARVFGDVDCDREVTVMDATLIQRYLAKLDNPCQVGERFYVNERN